MNQTDFTCRCGSGVPPAFQAQVPLAPTPPVKGRAALIWGVGSTLLSVLGFLGWGLFEQYDLSLAELHRDLKHFNEVSSGFVKKDTLQRFRDHFKEFQKDQQGFAVAKAQLEKELSTSEKARDEMAHELRALRERIAFVEGQHSPSPNVVQPGSAKQNISRNDLRAGNLFGP